MDVRSRTETAWDDMGAMRIRAVDSVGPGLGEAELMDFALHQAVAHLGALGGMAHRRGPDDRLHLVSTAGIPGRAGMSWDDIRQDTELAPARAVRTGEFVWVPGAGEPRRGGPEQLFGCGEGMAAVPVPGPDGPLGVLSLVTALPDPPSPEQRAFLADIARLISPRLASVRPETSTFGPVWWRVPWAPRLRDALSGVHVGSWDMDMEAGRLLADDTTLTTVGLSPDTFDQQVETSARMIHPDDEFKIYAEMRRAAQDHDACVYRYRVIRGDGSVVRLESRGHFSYDANGNPYRISGVSWEITEPDASEDWLGRTLRDMSDGFLALDTQSRIMWANVEAERLLGAAGHLTGKLMEEAAPEARSFGLMAAYRHVVQSREPVGVEIRSPINQRWYDMRVVPVTGGVTVYFTDVTEKRELEEEGSRAARVRDDRTAHLTELTESLAQAITVSDVVKVISERVLPLTGADRLLVALNEGGVTVPVGSIGYPAEFVDRLDGLAFAELPAPIAEVIGNRSPVFMPSGEEFTGRYPAFDDKQAWAFLPLIVSDRPVGYFVMSFAGSRRLEDERGVLVAISGLAAHALERARLFDAEHFRAQQLQRGLLPRNQHTLTAVTAAARYLPASAGAEVGGDWYDVIPLSSERVALVIGDVMGHGLAEAVTMGRLRTAVHNFADLELDPDELLTRLNALVADLGDDYLATCLYAIYDPATRKAVLASAGHPPPPWSTPTAPCRSRTSTPIHLSAWPSPPSRPSNSPCLREVCWFSTPMVWLSPRTATSIRISPAWPGPSPRVSAGSSTRSPVTPRPSARNATPRPWNSVRCATFSPAGCSRGTRTPAMTPPCSSPAPTPSARWMSSPAPCRSTRSRLVRPVSWPVSN